MGTRQNLIDENRAMLRIRLRRLEVQVADAQAALNRGDIPSGRLADSAIEADTAASVLAQLDMLDES
jgi:hypothetical protein